MKTLTGETINIQETTYNFAGYRGDLDAVRPRRDFTRTMTSFVLIPLLCLLRSGASTSLPYNCDAGFGARELPWSQAQKELRLQETTCSYAGYGRDFDAVRPRREFTRTITSCCLLAHSSSLFAAVWNADVSAFQLRCRLRKTIELPGSEAQKDWVWRLQRQLLVV